LEYVFEELAAARPLYLVDANGRNLLSKREQQVVALVAEGFTNRQISQELKLSEHTVKNYLFRVFEKLGISTRVELVLYALSQNPLGQPAAPEPPVSVVELSRRSPPKANFHQSPALSGSSHLR
jgi:DNA-binding CsgD family transcriptional regulator